MTANGKVVGAGWAWVQSFLGQPLVTPPQGNFARHLQHAGFPGVDCPGLDQRLPGVASRGEKLDDAQLLTGAVTVRVKPLQLRERGKRDRRVVLRGEAQDEVVGEIMLLRVEHNGFAEDQDGGGEASEFLRFARVWC